MSTLKRYLPVFIAIVLVALLIASKVFGWEDAFSVDALRAYLTGAGGWGIGVFFLAMVFSNLFGVPTVLFVIAALLTFDPVIGISLSFLGGLGAATNSYFFGRQLRPGSEKEKEKELPRSRLQTWMQKVLSTVDAHPFRVVVVLRLLLFVSGPLNLALAATGMRYRTYALGTAIGMVPVIGFYAVTLRCLA